MRMTPTHVFRSWCEKRAASILFAIALLLVAAIGYRGLQLKMDKVVPGRLPYYVYAVAISMLYHQGSPYVMYTEVQDRTHTMRRMIRYEGIFAGQMAEENAAFNNEKLAEIIATPIEAPEQTRLLPGDDKGMVDLVLIALVLFGAKVQGIYYMVMLLLLATVLAFFFGFRHRAEFCLAPVIVLGGFFVTMPAYLLDLHSYNIADPHQFAIFGLVPALHLILIAWDRGHWSWVRLAAAAFQVLVLVECIHVRSSAFWLVMLIVGAYVALLGLRYFGRQPGSVWSDQGFRAALTSSWAVGILFLGLCGLKLYQACVYDSRYATDLQHRYCWHNIGIGMGLHPRFATELQIPDIRDGWVVNWVQRSVSAERAETMFGKPGERLNPGVVAKDQQAYEAEVRKLVIAAMLKRPWSTIELFAFYKPRLMLRGLSWAAALSEFDERGLYAEGNRKAGCLPEPEIAAERNLHIRRTELAGFAIVISALTLWLRFQSKFLIALSVLLLAMMFGSAIPGMIAYPLLAVIGDFLLCVSVFALGIGVTIIHATVSRFLSAERGQPAAIADVEARTAA